MNVYVRELTRFLGQAGVHVDVFTRSQDEHVPHVLHDLGYCNRVVHINAGPEIPLPKPELHKYIPAFSREIMDFTIRKGLGYDLIHSHYWMSGVAAEYLKETWKVPIVHMFHTLGHMKNRVARNQSEFEGAYRLDGEQRCMDISDRLIVSTPAEVQQMEAYYQLDQNKIEIIPPGVDLSHFYPIPKDEAKAAIGIPQDAQMLLFVGRIEPLKGIDTLLHALAIMRDECHLETCSYHLAIIGGDTQVDLGSSGSEINRLKDLCQSLGLNDMVVFLGKRDQSTLPYYYSAAEVLVMPSYYESFGMVALESMACGTPVVASHTGGLAYLVQNGINGFTVSGGNVKELAKRLTQLIVNDELREKIGRQAAEFARSFSWETITAKMISVYDKVISKSPLQ
jgi:D-inositol-3-phosphate glycosyltransferase